MTSLRTLTILSCRIHQSRGLDEEFEDFLDVFTYFRYRHGFFFKHIDSSSQIETNFLVVVRKREMITRKRLCRTCCTYILSDLTNRNEMYVRFCHADNEIKMWEIWTRSEKLERKKTKIWWFDDVQTRFSDYYCTIHTSDKNMRHEKWNATQWIIETSHENAIEQMYEWNVM